MRVYNGTSWQDQAASPDTLTEREFLATAGQTVYTVTGGYRVGYTFVYVNGVLLGSADITATNGTTITFASALALNDEVRVLSFKAIGSVGVSDIAGLQTVLDAKASLTGAETLTNKTIALADNTLTGVAGLTTAQTFSAKQSFLGTPTTAAVLLRSATEIATIAATAATGTINYDAATQGILYYTSNASGNWTVNFRAAGTGTLNNMLSIGQPITMVHLVTQGATAYYNSAVQVDGTTTNVTTRWIGGAPTAGNASGIDSYRYLIFKTAAATFTVLASMTQFKA